MEIDSIHKRSIDFLSDSKLILAVELAQLNTDFFKNRGVLKERGSKQIEIIDFYTDNINTIFLLKYFKRYLIVFDLTIILRITKIGVT
jgi:hypothetical protein